MKKTGLVIIFVVILLAIGLLFVTLQSVYVPNMHSTGAEFSCSNALLETANEGISEVNENIKEAKSNLDELLSMQNFQEPVKSLLEVKYLSSAHILFVSAERIAHSGMLTPLSQIPLKDKYPLDLSKEIFSVCNTLSGEQGSAINAIINDIYSGKFGRSDVEYLKKLDVLLGRLIDVLANTTVYKNTQKTSSDLKTINQALIKLAGEKVQEH